MPTTSWMYLLARPVRCHQTDVGRDVGLISGYCTSVTCRTQVFARVEAGGCYEAERAGELSVARSPLGLRCVLDDRNPCRSGDLDQLLHGRDLTEEMDRHDGLGAGRDGGFDLAWIDKQIGRIAVD